MTSKLKESVSVQVYHSASDTEPPRHVTYPAGAFVGQIACLECDGTGWWGYGPEDKVNGPCINCKGTGRWWVGLL